jgi:4-hydroxybenzoate polyprenyltransferase
MRLYLLLIRTNHWYKNLIILIPLVASANIFNFDLLPEVILSIFSFSLFASSGYVVNDIFDYSKDSNHPIKKNRPIASEKISIPRARIIAVVLFLIASLLSLFLSVNFFIICLLYYLTSFFYSFVLKNIKFMDIVILTSFYILRILAGSIAFNINPSLWLISFSSVFFLSLSLYKRSIEYKIISNDELNKYSYRPYGISYQNKLRYIGVTLSIVSIILLFLYLLIGINSILYTNKNYLYLSIPLFIIWKIYIWFYKYNNIQTDDLVEILLNDRLCCLIYILIFVIFIFSL